MLRPKLLLPWLAGIQLISGLALGSWVAAPDSTKIYVRKRVTTQATGPQIDDIPHSLIAELGANIVDDKDTYIVIQIGQQLAPKALEALSPLADTVAVRDDFDRISFHTLPIDARAALPTYPTRWHRSTSLPPPSRDLFVMQFASLPDPAWLRELRNMGADIIDYVPTNAYIVLATRSTIQTAASRLPVQYVGILQPINRVSPELLTTSADLVDCVIELSASPEGDAALEMVRRELLATIDGPSRDSLMVTMTGTVSAAALPHLANQPGVLWIERYVPAVPSGEREAHIVGGSPLTTASGTPGDVLRPLPVNYRQWLADHGLTGSGVTYLNATVVALLDAGFDTGSSTDVHADFKNHTNQSVVTVVDYVGETCTPPPCNLSDCIGHGTLTAAVVAGNAGDTYSSTKKDAGSDYPFYEGLGVAPGAPIIAGRVFDIFNNTATTTSAFQNVVLPDLVARGVGITNNSWNQLDNDNYTSESQRWDKLVRSATGHDNGAPMTIVFAAGNYEDGGVPPSCNQTQVRHVFAPGNGKNVIAVGGSESFNPNTYPDPNLCPGAHNQGQYASNGQDMWDLSTFGTQDGRIKPDLVAPATAVEGAHTRYTPLCPGVADAVIDSTAGRPHSWSRGTSFAAPAVTGAADLLYSWFLKRTSNPPKPSLLKAMLINFAYDMTGKQVDNSGNLGRPPDAQQGWGKVDLARAFATDGRYDYSNESPATLLTANGNFVEFPCTGCAYTILDPSRPVRITLVWTDAPGNTFGGNAIRNNLDLKITIPNTTTYAIGNSIDASSGRSIIYHGSGGTYDTLNNVEQVVFTSTDIGSTQFTVRVTAASLVADAIHVWDSPGASQQDFSLFIDNVNVSNGLKVGTPTALVATAAATCAPTQVCTSADLSWTAAPGSPSNYKVFRRALASDPFSLVVTLPAQTAYTDSNGLSDGHTYAYQVTAVTSGVESPPSNSDLATLVAFTDKQDPIKNPITTIKADHVNQLRNAILGLRTYFGLGSVTWGQVISGGTALVTVKAAHITEMQAAIDAAIGAPTVPYTPVLVNAPILGVQIDELRRRVR